MSRNFPNATPRTLLPGRQPPVVVVVVAAVASMASFDYHAELEVSPTATKEEIRQAYFRLALIHHPDKNPGNVAEATAKFQRLQTAYEQLQNPPTRRQTGAAPAARPQTHRHSYHYDESDSDDYDDFWSDEEDEPYFDVPRYHSYGSSGPSGSYTYYSYDYYEELFESYLADRRRWEQERSARGEAAAREREARHRYEEQQRQAKRAAKEAARQAELEAEQREREAGIAAERAKQDDVWTKAGAVTKDEKLRACLHSDYCKTDKQEKKAKCSACKKNAGVRPFECPHCASFLCHQCQTRFSKRREKAAVSQPESAATSEPEAEEELEEDELEVDAKPTENGHISPEPEEAPEPEEERNTQSAPISEPERKPEAKAGRTNGHSAHPESHPAPKTEPKPVAQTIDDICFSAGIRVSKKAEQQVESDEELARRLQEEWNEEERRQTQAQGNKERQKKDAENQPPEKSKQSKQPAKQKTPRPQKVEAGAAAQPSKKTMEHIARMNEANTATEPPKKPTKQADQTKEVRAATRPPKTSTKQASETKHASAATEPLKGPNEIINQMKEASVAAPPATNPWKHTDPVKEASPAAQLQPKSRVAHENSVNKATPKQSVTDVVPPAPKADGVESDRGEKPGKARCTHCKRFGHLEPDCWLAHPELRRAAGKGVSNFSARQPLGYSLVTELSSLVDVPHEVQPSQATDSSTSLDSEAFIESPETSRDDHPTFTKARCPHCKRFGHVESECWVAHPELKKACKAPLMRNLSQTTQPSVPAESLASAEDAKPVKGKKERCAGCKRVGHLEPQCWIAHPELRKIARSKRSATPVAESSTSVDPAVSPKSFTDEARRNSAFSFSFSPTGTPDSAQSLPQGKPAESENLTQQQESSGPPSSSKPVSRKPNSTRMFPLKEIANSNRSGQQAPLQHKHVQPETSVQQQNPEQTKPPSSNKPNTSKLSGFPVCLKLDTNSCSTPLPAVEDALMTSFGDLTTMRAFRPKLGIWHAEFTERESQVKALKAGVVSVADVSMKIERWRG
ncbi:hypothetical protein BDV96DRAFT_694575 [Lophiotrema nucula]|uniref:J domain-containing protein n=1 Tax=Lophiotrema nucula TaxID=690887 RepID=A0A6A5YIC0_9PLEO|nr:hypothetical protein BDV96DRAFT_694575 [Lophiotrema nucula]